MLTYFESLKILSDKELYELDSLSMELAINKNEFWIQEGKVCNEIAVVKSGILRSYCYCYENTDETNWIYFPNEIMMAYSSMLTQTPSEENIQALDNTLLSVIKKNDLYKLFESSGNWQKVGRIIAEKQYLKLENHLFSLQKRTAKERYEKIISDYPQYIQKVPLQYLASYLGMTQRHLSRIRKETKI